MRKSTVKTALAIFAHPDDETLLAGALIASLVADGWTVHLLCLAPGTDDDLAHRMELACAELGVSSVSSLRYSPASSDAHAVQTPQLLSAPQPVVVSQIAGGIAELAPSMILTHSARGDYGHADHAYCHGVTLAAASEAAPGASLYALAWPETALRLNSLAGRIIGRNRRKIIAPSASPATHRSRATVRLNVRDYLAVRKSAALHYRKEIAAGPPTLRMLEAAPIWLQRFLLGTARLTDVSLSQADHRIGLRP